MHRTACPFLLVTLAVWLVMTRRRLTDTERELRLVQVMVRAYERPDSESATSSGAAVTASHAPTVTPAEGPAVQPADFSDWERAVPPMDS